MGSMESVDPWSPWIHAAMKSMGPFESVGPGSWIHGSMAHGSMELNMDPWIHILMDPYGSLQILMDPYGSLWFGVDAYGSL